MVRDSFQFVHLARKDTSCLLRHAFTSSFRTHSYAQLVPLFGLIHCSSIGRAECQLSGVTLHYCLRTEHQHQQHFPVGYSIRQYCPSITFDMTTIHGIINELIKARRLNGLLYRLCMSMLHVFSCCLYAPQPFISCILPLLPRMRSMHSGRAC